MNAKDATRLYNVVVQAAHARGMVFVNVSSANASRIVAGESTPFCDAVSAALDEFVTRAAKRYPAVQQAFVKTQLLKGADKWRTDSQLVLVLQQLDWAPKGTAVAPIAVCTFGAADAADRVFKDKELKRDVGDGRVLEIDFVGVLPDLRVDGSPPLTASFTTGTLLTLFVIASQLKRRSRGAPLFRAVVTSLAQTRDGVQTFAGVTKRLGFVNKAHSKGDGDLDVVALTHDKFKALDGKVHADAIRDLCSLEPRSGKPRCI